MKHNVSSKVINTVSFYPSIFVRNVTEEDLNLALYAEIHLDIEPIRTGLKHTIVRELERSLNH